LPVKAKDMAQETEAKAYFVHSQMVQKNS